MENIKFDETKARFYQKRIDVLAFRSDDSINFNKSWGYQKIRKNGWVIIPLIENNGVSNDIYGCDEDIFAKTYEPSPSLRPNHYRKKEQIQAYQPHCEFSVKTILKDGHIETRISKGSDKDWIVKAPDGEVYIIKQAEFLRTYIKVIEKGDGYCIKDRDEHWKNDGAPKRILTLDGGGVRGILTLQYLSKIEKILAKRHKNETDFRLSHYFDLIAGTSTGAIIAAGLAKGMSVKEVTTLYNELAGDIFKRYFWRIGFFSAKYNVLQLRKHLKEIFAGNTMGSHSIETGLLIVAKRLDTGSVWPMSNNPKSHFFKAKNTDTFLANEDYLLTAVIRASTAAPSYFSPEFIEISKEKDGPNGMFVDGGVSPHNNPALLALQLVTLKGFKAEWALDPDKLLLVSVGTGSASTGTSNSWFAAHHAMNALLSLMDDCANSVEIILQWLSNSPTARTIDLAMEDLSTDLLATRPLIQYLRYNVQLEPKWLKENLDINISKKLANNLTKMDQPNNMSKLTDYGQIAAEKQIKDAHFPTSFDLGK